VALEVECASRFSASYATKTGLDVCASEHQLARHALLADAVEAKPNVDMMILRVTSVLLIAAQLRLG
jgi:hypothetical protein